MSKKKVGIVNITSYTGMELARLLSRHPEVEIASVTGRSTAGMELKEALPHLSHYDITITEELGEVDIAFTALPHKESASKVIELTERGVKVIDISADFRLKDPAAYPKWYGFEHPSAELLKNAVYGLPEIYKEQIAEASLIANPGCYPTSAILALSPVLKNGLIDEDIIIDSKSALSGAGRTLKNTSHYCEANETTTAYALGGHRHLPEITQELSLQGGVEPLVTFVPHLVPMTRGILSTCYGFLSMEKCNKVDSTYLFELYADFYKDSPFVKVLSSPPSTKQTYGSNYCLLHPTIDSRTGRVVIISAIDNLVKGAAGQAVQNMNIMLGLPEETGLDMVPVYP